MPKMNESEQLTLLKKIIAPAAVNNILPVDLSRLEKIIKERIPNALEKNAPPNFPELYFDFEYVYSKFYDFLLFNPLIGKTVVALGGGFSSGKSTFLNTILGNAKILPTAIRPSTSVPAYVIKSESESAEGINTFGAKVPMDFADIRAIAHGFGETEDSEDEITLGHLLRSLFVATPQMPYENIAFLDTPGYSKADSEDYSAKTDEKIAHSQLNASDYILWFIAADAGTISVDDVNFLANLDKDIPKFIIINKADKAPNAESLGELKEKTKAALDLKGIRYEDVLTYSRKENVACDREQVQKYLQRLNTGKNEVDFAHNFKKLFVECKNYYDDMLNEEQRNLSYINRALTFATDNEELTQYLSVLLADTKTVINNLSNLRIGFNELKNVFFSEIKIVADSVNIYMPEPSEIDLIDKTSMDLLNIAERLVREKGLTSNRDILHEMKNNMPDLQNEENKKEQAIDFKSLRNTALQEPLYNHPLAENNSKEPYLMLLVSLLAVDGANASNWKYIYRIAAGGNYEDDVHELLPNALRMNEKKMMNAIEAVKACKIKDLFALESLYFLYQENHIYERTLRYLSCIYSLLDISVEMLRQGYKLLNIILSQSEEEFLKNLQKFNCFNLWNIRCYVPFSHENMTKDIQAATSYKDTVILYTAELSDCEELYLDEWEADTIKFIAVDFKNVFKINSTTKNVYFLCCSFTYDSSASRYAIWLSGNNQYLFKNCVFDGYESHAFLLEATNVTITACEFSNCSTIGKLLVLCANSRMEDSTFMNCRSYYPRNYPYDPTTYIVGLSRISIERNNKFIDCVADSFIKRKGWWD